MQTEGQELGPYEPVSDVLVLAAIERASRHSLSRGVHHWAVAEHLGFLHSAATTRRLRPQLESLRAAGLIERLREHGRYAWALTGIGRRRLTAAQRASEVGDLPESPQHRRWRHAREEAERRHDGLRTLLYLALEAAEQAAKAPTGTDSETWFALGERLGAAFWLMGSVTHCREEWAEPDDALPDDDHPDGRAGRRITGSWNRHEAIAKGGA